MVVSLHKNLNELEATKLMLKNGNFYVAYILEKVTLLCPTEASCIWPPSTSFTSFHPSLLPSSRMDLLIPQACPGVFAGATPLP